MLHDLGRKNDYLVIFCTIIAIFARKSVREISQNLCGMKKILFIIGSLREKSFNRQGGLCMKDYPDRMTPKQARVFGEDVLNIVSQIPRGKVTTYGHIAEDGGENLALYAWSGGTAVSSGGEYRRAYCSWVVSTTDTIGRRGCDVQG